MGRIQGDLLDRTFRFAVMVLELVDRLPNNQKAWTIGKQIIRSGTSIGANIREADHALTAPDFASKCSIARKEAAEVLYWLELAEHSGLLCGEQLRYAKKEADEIVSVLSAVVRNTQLAMRSGK